VSLGVTDQPTPAYKEFIMGKGNKPHRKEIKKPKKDKKAVKK